MEQRIRRIKDDVVEQVEAYWGEWNAPMEYRLISRRWSKQCITWSGGALNFSEVIDDMVRERRVVVLTNSRLKRWVVPVSYWGELSGSQREMVRMRLEPGMERASMPLSGEPTPDRASIVVKPAPPPERPKGFFERIGMEDGVGDGVGLID